MKLILKTFCPFVSNILDFQIRDIILCSLDYSAWKFPPSIKYQMENTRSLSLQSIWSIYSNLLDRMINIPSIEMDQSSSANCLDIERLYYIEASMKSVMIASKKKVDNLMELFNSEKCGNKRTDTWHWKFTSEMYNMIKERDYYITAFLQNSLQWKDNVSVALELQLAFGLNKNNLPFGYDDYKKYSIRTNPYRIDKNGFEGTVLTFQHLHQAFILLLIGIILPWQLFNFEIWFQVWKMLRKILKIKTFTKKTVAKSSEKLVAKNQLQHSAKGHGKKDTKLPNKENREETKSNANDTMAKEKKKASRSTNGNKINSANEKVEDKVDENHETDMQHRNKNCAINNTVMKKTKPM